MKDIAKIAKIGKITTQQARKHHVNKVKRFLLRISANTYLLQSIPWIPIQTFMSTAILTLRNIVPHVTLTMSLGCL